MQEILCTIILTAVFDICVNIIPYLLFQKPWEVQENFTCCQIDSSCDRRSTEPFFQRVILMVDNNDE